MAVKVQFEIGHHSKLRTKDSTDIFTHDWEIYVQGVNPKSNISTFVEKVVFNLHETFPKPKRVVKEPPYVIRESGYAGFQVPIDIYFRSRHEPRRVRFEYDLELQQSGPPIFRSEIKEFVFERPSDDLRTKLLKCGGVPLTRAINNMNESSNHATSNEDMMINKPKLSGSEKKHKARIDDSFANLFGPPITKTSKPSPDNKTQNSTASTGANNSISGTNASSSSVGNNIKSNKDKSSSSGEKTKDKHKHKQNNTSPHKEKKSSTNEKQKNESRKEKNREKEHGRDRNNVSNISRENSKHSLTGSNDNLLLNSPRKGKGVSPGPTSQQNANAAVGNLGGNAVANINSNVEVNKAGGVVVGSKDSSRTKDKEQSSTSSSSGKKSKKDKKDRDKDRDRDKDKDKEKRSANDQNKSSLNNSSKKSDKEAKLAPHVSASAVLQARVSTPSNELKGSPDTVSSSSSSVPNVGHVEKKSSTGSSSKEEKKSHKHKKKDKSKDKDKERDKDKDKDRERDKDKDRDREKEKEKEKDREKEREKDREKDKEKEREKERERDKLLKEKDRENERFDEKKLSSNNSSVTPPSTDMLHNLHRTDASSSHSSVSVSSPYTNAVLSVSSSGSPGKRSQGKEKKSKSKDSNKSEDSPAHLKDMTNESTMSSSSSSRKKSTLSSGKSNLDEDLELSDLDSSGHSSSDVIPIMTPASAPISIESESSNGSFPDIPPRHFSLQSQTSTPSPTFRDLPMIKEHVSSSSPASINTPPGMNSGSPAKDMRSNRNEKFLKVEKYEKSERESRKRKRSNSQQTTPNNTNMLGVNTFVEPPIKQSKKEQRSVREQSQSPALKNSEISPASIPSPLSAPIPSPNNNLNYLATTPSSLTTNPYYLNSPSNFSHHSNHNSNSLSPQSISPADFINIHNNYHNGAPNSIGNSSSASTSSSSLWPPDYLIELQELHQKIMTLQDNDELQQVVEMIAATGCYEITTASFDFDLCKLDRMTVQRLQDFLRNEIKERETLKSIW